jgi:hypothetical protein
MSRNFSSPSFVQNVSLMLFVCATRRTLFEGMEDSGYVADQKGFEAKAREKGCPDNWSRRNVFGDGGRCIGGD